MRLKSAILRMGRRLVLCAAPAFLWLPVSAPAQQPPLQGSQVARRADAWLTRYEAAGDFSGVVLLAQGDRIFFEKAYGFADFEVRSPNRLDTRFRVASISKTFAAGVVERLVALGKLRYTDPLSRYVAGIPNGDSITIEQLLSHESGVGVLDSEDIYRRCIPHDELLHRLTASRPLFAPGKDSQYSNEGYFLLAAIVERVTGGSYAEVLSQSVFSALQLENSGTACRDLPEGGNAIGNVATASDAHLLPLPFNEAALDGAGSVYSTAEDLYHWLRAVDTNPAFGVSQLKYPYGWGKRKYSNRDLIEQSGQLEGFTSHVAIYPKEHIYAVVLSNIQSGFASRIPRDLEAVLFATGNPSEPIQVTPITLSARLMLQFAGTYHSKQTIYPQTLEVRDGQLAMHWGADPFWREMAMTDGDTFFLRAEYAQIRFERGPDGYVRRMVWNWPGGAHLSFEKDQVPASPQPTTPDAH